MKLQRLVVTGLTLASLGLSAGASAQNWSGQRPGPAIGRDAPPPPPRPDLRRFDDRRLDDRRLDDRRFDERRFDERRFDQRRFDNRGRGYWGDRGRGWGRDDRGWGRGGDRCWIEYRRGGRVTVCR